MADDTTKRRTIALVNREKSGPAHRLWFPGTVAAAALVIVLLVVVVIDIDRFGARDALALVAVAAIALGLLAELKAWRADRAALGEAGAQTSDLEERLEDQAAARERAEELASERAQEIEAREDELKRDREQHAAELRKREDELHKERLRGARMSRAREAERSWSRELREQVSRLYAQRGALGDTGDIRELVLRVAMELLDASKGLLLSASDDDDDGRLDLVSARGFDRDPKDSAIAQRFAKEVLDREETIREDEPVEAVEAKPAADGEADGATRPADDEIDNLVAIPIYIRDEFNGVLVCANRPDGFESYEDEVLLALGDHAAVVLENNRLHGELRASYLATVAMLAEAIEAKDPMLRGHSEDTSRYVGAVAERLGLDEQRREELVFASVLHDMGKIGISERILLKPGPLTPEEYSAIQLHPRIGYRLVQQVPALRGVAPAILYHHERYDGNGYPSRLRGEQIPIEARIIAVADSFSAMTTDRPYRAARSIAEACAELERCAGTQFDPEVVRLFVEEVRRTPPQQLPDPAEAILADPELATRREAGEPVFGHGALEVIDNLTLLYSRRYLHELAAKEAERAAVQGRPFGLALFALAGVAELNRSQGYAAGDAAIKTVAQAVDAAAVRHGGTGARHGGRRLALLVPGADEERMKQVVAEVLAAVRDVDVRMGVAAWRPAEAGDDVIARARAGLEGQGVAAPAATPSAPPPTSP